MSQVSTEQLEREAVNRERNRAFAAALLAGQTATEIKQNALVPNGDLPDAARNGMEIYAKEVSGGRQLAPGVSQGQRDSGNHADALKTLGLYGKHVRMKPVMSGFRPTRKLFPVVFPYHEGQHLTKLSRKVSRAWRLLFTSVSTSSLAGGRLNGSQGRNAVAIIEHLRQKTYLKTDSAGRPVQAREQTVEVVAGAKFSLAAELGMSPATFYRALGHPLMHYFVRTQKVQRIEADSRARRNVATLFSVALYEPELPDDLEAACFAEAVDLGVVFVESDSNSQDEGTKGRPNTSQKQKKNCGKLSEQLRGSSSGGPGREVVLGWLDEAALITRAAERSNVPSFVSDDGNLEGCIDRCRETHPELWEFASHIAIYHDDPEQQAVAAIGYYKALIHLGVPTVRFWVKRLAKWQRNGQNIETPGRLLTYLLNKEARKKTGYPISDLGTLHGQLLA